uniref:Histone 2A-domain-containing protein n=1 Tax=Marseillevirus LCMAC103 TaxID=2506604 RepID=A0A481YUJ1_9VIRU|nr:MAG: histone 2A-domain-containing protein [Marseillevirus LCMAC103]
MDDARTPKRGRKTTPKYSKYIEEIKKAICPDFAITADASACFNNLINITLAKIFNNMDILTAESDRKTLSWKDVDAAIQLTFDGPLYKASTSFASEAVSTYKAGTATPRSDRAGLILPVTRIEKAMMTSLRATRKTDTSAVFLAGSVENVVRALFKATGDRAAAQRKQRLTQLHISRAIDGDPTFAALYQNCILTLDPKKHKTKKTKKKSKAAAGETAAGAPPAPPAPKPAKAKRAKGKTKTKTKPVK